VLFRERLHLRVGDQASQSNALPRETPSRVACDPPPRDAQPSARGFDHAREVARSEMIALRLLPWSPPSKLLIYACQTYTRPSPECHAPRAPVRSCGVLPERRRYIDGRGEETDSLSAIFARSAALAQRSARRRSPSKDCAFKSQGAQLLDERLGVLYRSWTMHRHDTTLTKRRISPSASSRR